jgi:hypothetical protein
LALAGDRHRLHRIRRSERPADKGPRPCDLADAAIQWAAVQSVQMVEGRFVAGIGGR